MMDAAQEAFYRAIRTAKAAPKNQRQQRRSGELAPVGDAMDGFIRDQGWQGASAFATITTNWSTLVGQDLAEHVAPIRCQDAILTIQAESTAWATQVRMLLPHMLDVLTQALGPGIVTSIEVLGPTSPSWVKGPRRVKGRGPRDTYG
jgi:predicted nucleic acid-binding Zn ribbon protein